MYIFSIEPRSAALKVGQSFQADIWLNGTESLGYAQIELTFAHHLTFQQFNFSQSAFKSPLGEVANNGMLLIQRGIPPGTSPISGRLLFGSIIFSVVDVGQSRLSFTVNCQALQFPSATDVFDHGVDGFFAIRQAGPATRLDLDDGIDALAVSVDALDAVIP